MGEVVEERTEISVPVRDASSVEENTSPNHSIKSRLNKILKEDSTLSILKISATALTAISMALISTRLTSIFNSIILVGIVSALTAIVSEFYRVILSVTTLGAQKVLATRFQTNSDGTTTEIPIVSSPAAITDNPVTDQASYSENSGRFRKYFRENPLMKMVAVFIVFSAATIAANYFITSSSSKPASVNNYTTIQKPVESITDSEKQRIIDAAVGTSLSDTSAQKDSLQSQINNLQKVNDDLEKSLASLQKEKSLTDDALSKMEAKVKAIEQKMNTEPSVTPAPTPTNDPLNVLPKPTPSPTATSTNQAG